MKQLRRKFGIHIILLSFALSIQAQSLCEETTPGPIPDLNSFAVENVLHTFAAKHQKDMFCTAKQNQFHSHHVSCRSTQQNSDDQ